MRTTVSEHGGQISRFKCNNLKLHSGTMENNIVFQRVISWKADAMSVTCVFDTLTVAATYAWPHFASRVLDEVNLLK